MKLKPKNIHRHKPGRPPEKGNLAKISRLARVIETNDFFFYVKFGKGERCRFEKKDASKYIKPMYGAKVRCIYHGDKNYNISPYKVYTNFNEILFEEKSTIETKLK